MHALYVYVVVAAVYIDSQNGLNVEEKSVCCHLQTEWRQNVFIFLFVSNDYIEEWSFILVTILDTIMWCGLNIKFFILLEKIGIHYAITKQSDTLF